MRWNKEKSINVLILVGTLVILIFILFIVSKCDNRSYSKFQVEGHTYLRMNGIPCHDPECQKCKENLKETIRQVELELFD